MRGKSVRLALKPDEKSIKEAERLLMGIPGGVEKVAALAVNRSLEAGKTTMRRHIGKNYTINQWLAAESIYTVKAYPKVPDGVLGAKGSPLSSRLFDHDPAGADTTGSNRRQVRLKVKKKSSPGALRTGFVWDGGHGTDLHSIYIRTGEKRIASKGYHKGKKVAVIRKSLSPSVPQMVERDGGSELIQRRMEEILAKRMDHETLRLLEKVTKK